MSRILITGYEGSFPRVFSFESTTEYVSINNTSINRIDLSEAHRMNKLQFLDISQNKIDQVNLKQLSRCYNLSSLNLSHNWVESIDLSPLSNCSRLSWLSLSSNHISSIDLRPLSKCKELEYLFLSSNRFEKLDLSPLAQCPNLRELGITTAGDPGFYDIENALDLRPLIGLRRLKKIHISRTHYATLGVTQKTIQEKPRGITEVLKKCKNVTIERLVNHRIKKHGLVKGITSLENEISHLPSSYWYSVREQVLEPLGLSIIAGYDGRISELVKGTEKQGKDWANQVIARAADEISKGATTILFDLDTIPMTLPSHGKLRAAILESRSNEIREARIFVCERCVDFREVLYTAWGFQMLKGEGQWIFGTSGKQLIDLRDRLRNLGFGLIFKSVKIKDTWPNPRNEPSLKIRQSILGYIDRYAKPLLKDKAMQCILKSNLHPLRNEIEKIMTEIYGGSED